jgi:hypothetical protein
MSAFALKLFNIQIRHTYYANGISNDFEILPDEATQAFMHHHRMQLLSYEGTYEMIWLTANLEHPFEVFHQKMADVVLRFHVKFRNPYVINFSTLKIQPETIYAFANTEGITSLHKNTYVDETDQVPFHQTMNSLASADPLVWGNLQIQLGKVWRNPADQLPIPYTLQIKAREVIWRYQVVDLHQRIKSPLKIVIDQDDSYFIYSGLDDNTKIHLFESKQPIALRATTQQFFSLKMYPKSSNKSSASTEKVLIQRLPLPNVRLLENNVVKGGVFYSDVVVYV